jgi:hypothetical protein
MIQTTDDGRLLVGRMSSSTATPGRWQAPGDFGYSGNFAVTVNGDFDVLVNALAKSGKDVTHKHDGPGKMPSTSTPSAAGKSASSSSRTRVSAVGSPV